MLIVLYFSANEKERLSSELKERKKKLKFIAGISNIIPIEVEEEEEEGFRIRPCSPKTMKRLQICYCYVSFLTESNTNDR